MIHMVILQSVQRQLLRLSIPLRLVLLLCLCGIVVAADAPAPFKITTKRADDKVKVEQRKDGVVFAIRSPIGISQATIQRTGDKWPDSVVLRLHLSGLEHLKIAAEKTELGVSVSSHEPETRVGVGTVGEEGQAVDTGSAFWMEVRRLDAHGKPTTAMPLKDGWFEMRLPGKLFADNPESMTLEWIDFYRV